MKKKKSKQGGARPGAGRKPVDDPKILVQIYVRESIIMSHGGLAGFKDFVYKQIDR